jgi:hypothetical protein
LKTRAQRFLESRSFLVLTGLLYLGLTAVLVYVIGARSKPDIGTLLSKLVPKVLWVNFLLIAFGVVLCRRDIAGAFRDLFKTEGGGGSSPPYPTAAAGAVNTAKAKGASLPFTILSTPGIRLLMILMAGILLVTLVAPQTHRIYYDEDIYANMGQNIAYTGQAGMANYGTFEYGEYFVNWLLYNKDPAGWPYLMSLVFQLFGTDETFAFYLNNLLFAGGIVVVFFIAGMLAGGAPFPALLAALVYALIPHNLIWANTISAENSAAVFGGLVVLCALAWLRTREPRRLFLLAALLPFACAMRPESSLIALWVLAAAAMNLFADGKRRDIASSGPSEAPETRFRHPLATRVFWAMGTVAFALILPILWHFHAMSGESWGAEGAKFATSFFIGNVMVNGFYFVSNHEFPLPFTLLALISVAAWKRRSGSGGRRGPEALQGSEMSRRQGALPGPDGQRGSKGLRQTEVPEEPNGTWVDFRLPLLMLLWFLLFWGIFLFFYAGSYKYGADVRFALLCFMPVAVLAGLGGDVLRGRLDGLSGRISVGENRLPVVGLLVLLLLIAWLKFLPLIRTVGQEAWGARYDHLHAREFIGKIPNRSVVLTHIPTMLLLWGQSAIQTFAGVNNTDLIRDLMTRYNGHVYFHRNYWCNTANDSNKTICDAIAQRYDLEPVATAREQSYEYGLYRMTFKK